VNAMHNAPEDRMQSALRELAKCVLKRLLGCLSVPTQYIGQAHRFVPLQPELFSLLRPQNSNAGKD